MNSFIVKKEKDFIRTWLTTDRLIPHNFVCTNFNTVASLGDFGGVLGQKRDYFFA